MTYLELADSITKINNEKNLDVEKSVMLHGDHEGGG